MAWIESLLLALVQGVTEFLPISSTAHLVLLQRFLATGTEEGLLLILALHLGTLLAVWITFPGRYSSSLRILCSRPWVAVGVAVGGGNARPEAADRDAMGWFRFLVWGTLPVVVGGGLVLWWLPSFQESILWVALANVLFGSFLWLGERFAGDRVGVPTVWDGIWVGLAQALALFPGVSRSGVVITAAMFCGHSRRSAAEISMILSGPVIVLAMVGGVLSLGFRLDSDRLWGAGMEALVSGAVAFFVAWLVIRLLLAWVERIGFIWFVLYRLVLGLVLLGLVWGGSGA